MNVPKWFNKMRPCNSVNIESEVANAVVSGLLINPDWIRIMLMRDEKSIPVNMQIRRSIISFPLKASVFGFKIIV
jgi:hypothetical protein